MRTVRNYRLPFIDIVKIPLTPIMFFLLFRTIPSHGNTADINLTVLHRNFLGVDEFLGQVSLPLRDFDVYERPKSKWFPLKCKPGQNKNDYRGEIEVNSGYLNFWLPQLGNLNHNQKAQIADTLLFSTVDEIKSLGLKV